MQMRPRGDISKVAVRDGAAKRFENANFHDHTLSHSSASGFSKTAALVISFPPARDVAFWGRVERSAYAARSLVGADHSRVIAYRFGRDMAAASFDICSTNEKIEREIRMKVTAARWKQLRDQRLELL